ncbi:MAG: hypothetical protein HYS81_04430 [Candidatus Aenigmatarchaeota archaeon]|nr:MAG: hypothetical protein HYS81_04430 [Candidatus Aenigmarchaeota archaeon]
MPDDYGEEEYEVIPLTPLRRMEERLRKVEKKDENADREFIRDVMDLIKANQKLVDEVVKANNSLRQDLQAIPPKIDEVVESWKQLVELLKKATGEESMPESIVEKFDRLIELNEQVLEASKKTQGPAPPAYAQPPGTSKYPRIRIVK